LIYSLEDKQFTYVSPDGYINKYEGIDFQIGKQDCYTLVIKYFKEEFDIEIPDFYKDRNLDWHKEDFNFLNNAVSQINCEIIDAEDLENNDIVALKYRGNRTHLGIILNNNLLLHHPMGKKSIIEPFHSFKNKVIYGIRIKK